MPKRKPKEVEIIDLPTEEEMREEAFSACELEAIAREDTGHNDPYYTGSDTDPFLDDIDGLDGW